MDHLYWNRRCIPMNKYEDHTSINIEKFETAVQNTTDHVYVLLLKRLHGREKHTMKAWMDILENQKKVQIRPCK